MTVDPEWEKAHAERAWGKYPHPAAVEFIGRHYGMDGRGLTALDIGAGAGACTWMLAREGFLVWAAEGSMSAAKRARDRLAADGIGSGLARVTICDVTVMDWPAPMFDCIIDVCCLSCVPEDEAAKVVERAYGWLKPGGRFLMVAAASDCDPAVHGEFKVRQASSAEVARLVAPFPVETTFLGKHTRRTRRGYISEWVVEAQKQGT